MKDPLSISIITPSFNQARFLEKTILSVINQEYPSDTKEHIIIDGNSRDNSVEVIKKYQQWIKYWVSEPDAGQPDAINKGFQRVNGEIVGWLNSDDNYFSNDIFQKVSDFFKKHSDVYVCYGDNVYIDENDKILYLRKAPRFYSHELLKVWNYIHQPTVFFRREILSHFKLDTSLHYSLDYDLWLRLADVYKFQYIDQVVAASRWHQNCKTISNTCVFFSELEKIHDNYGKPFLAKFIKPKYTAKFFYNIQRIYSLAFVNRMKNANKFEWLSLPTQSSLLKRQILGMYDRRRGH